MSEYQPKVGDRVRVVLEGEVTEAHTFGPHIKVAAEFDREHEIWHNRRDVSVEKVSPPLPTTPGSVVRISPQFPFAGLLFHRAAHGRWISDDCDAWNDGQLRGGGYEVIFDAGQVTP